MSEPLDALVAELLGSGASAAQVAAANALARPERWRQLHVDAGDATDVLLWGEIGSSFVGSGGSGGSGATMPLYRVACVLQPPAFSCTCPAMRKPCKHGLAILLAYARAPEAFIPLERPPWVAEWAAARARRAQRKDARSAEAVAIAFPEAQAKRAAEREARIAAGLDELERWLTDLTRQGLAGADARPYAFWDGPAARLVDAQAPGLARRVRALHGVLSQSGAAGSWPERLLERLGLLHLLVAAYRRANELPDDLRAEVRHLVGWTVAQDELLARGPVVSDRWRVVGWRIEEDERLRSQRVWLLGETTGRFALILGFSPIAAPLDRSLYPGTTVDADLVFFPGVRAHRALVKERRETTAQVRGLVGVDLLSASADYATALAHNPWLEDAPVVLGDVAPVRGENGGWLLRDAGGRVVPVSRRAALAGRDLTLVALAGGQAVLTFGEWNGRSLLPLGVGTKERYVPLDA